MYPLLRNEAMSKSDGTSDWSRPSPPDPNCPIAQHSRTAVREIFGRHHAWHPMWSPPCETSIQKGGLWPAENSGTRLNFRSSPEGVRSFRRPEERVRPDSQSHAWEFLRLGAAGSGTSSPVAAADGSSYTRSMEPVFRRTGLMLVEIRSRHASDRDLRRKYNFEFVNTAAGALARRRPSEKPSAGPCASSRVCS